MTSREEQETTITFMRDDTVVSVYTSSTPHLRRLRNLVSTRDFIREVRGGEDWGEFECDAAFFHLFSAFRGKRAVSAETRAARAKQLAAARELRRSSAVDAALLERDG